MLVELSTVLPGTQLTMQNKVGIFLTVWAFLSVTPKQTNFTADGCKKSSKRTEIDCTFHASHLEIMATTGKTESWLTVRSSQIFKNLFWSFWNNTWCKCQKKNGKPFRAIQRYHFWRLFGSSRSSLCLIRVFILVDTMILKLLFIYFHNFDRFWSFNINNILL